VPEALHVDGVSNGMKQKCMEPHKFPAVRTAGGRHQEKTIWRNTKGHVMMMGKISPFICLGNFTPLKTDQFLWSLTSIQIKSHAKINAIMAEANKLVLFFLQLQVKALSTIRFLLQSSKLEKHPINS
jgi:hypothetical protein